MYATHITRTAPSAANSLRVSAKFTTLCWRHKRSRQCRCSRQESPSCPPSRLDPDLSTKLLLITSTRTAKTFTGEPLGKYFIHGLGHHVGLKMHHVPTIPLCRFDKGMGSRLELEVNLHSEEKLGVRIEEVKFAVGQDGKLITVSSRPPLTVHGS